MYHSNQKIIRNKVGLLNLAEELGNVSKACKVMGLSRDTFYRYKSAVDEGGVSVLIEKSRRQPNLKNKADEALNKLCLTLPLSFLLMANYKPVTSYARKVFLFLQVGVRCIWLRNNLGSTRLRLKELERRSANENFILTDSQVAALEKKKDDDLACGEIETAHPGYLGSQDTFYVGTLKGVGCVYHQTFVDTYSKVAHCKLYTNKTPITAADLLNDRVLPFMEEHGAGLFASSDGPRNRILQ